jgi:hypothetical protein
LGAAINGNRHLLTPASSAHLASAMRQPRLCRQAPNRLSITLAEIGERRATDLAIGANLFATEVPKFALGSLTINGLEAFPKQLAAESRVGKIYAPSIGGRDDPE